MARLVIFHRGQLIDIVDAAAGVDLTLGDGTPMAGAVGQIPSPILRVTCRDGSLAFVRLADAHPTRHNGAPSRGAALAHGDRVEAGPMSIHVWSPTAESGGDDLPEADLRRLFRLTRDLDLIRFDGLMDRLLGGLVEALGAERGFILLRNARTGALREAVSHHIPRSELGAAASRTAVRRALDEGRPLVTGDAGSDLGDAVSVRAEGIRSVIAAPLPGPSGPVGVVYLDSRAARKLFSSRELALVDTFTSTVGAAVAAALEREDLRRDVSCLKVVHDAETRREHDVRHLVAHSAAMASVQRQVAAVGRQDVTVLVLGESGTGKELVARAVHDGSPRRDGPFVAVNCSALSRDVVESELFGHEAGAFTGARERRTGRFELACGGTIFLDEVGELDPDVQVKLLRVLEERQVERVGGSRPLDLDVRVVAATNRELRNEVTAGTFREDLFYRLNVFPLTLPPLRERSDDVAPLVEHFVTLCNARMGRSIQGVTEPALDALRRYRWPGNVRELRNVVERAFILTSGDLIDLDSLPGDITGAVAAVPGLSGTAIPEGTPLAEARERFELGYMTLVMRRHGANIAAAAKELGIPRSTVYRKFATAGLDPKNP